MLTTLFIYFFNFINTMAVASTRTLYEIANEGSSQHIEKPYQITLDNLVTIQSEPLKQIATVAIFLGPDILVALGHHARLTAKMKKMIPCQVVEEIPATESTQDRHRLLKAIDDIVDELATKRNDICYVIENNALFNLQYPATKAFEEHLMYVQDNKADFNLQELDENVEKLQDLWVKAVIAAEGLGFTGLNDPLAGRRAYKVAQLATKAQGAEQDVAWKHLAALLKVLDITLPKKHHEQLEAHSLKQLTA